MLALLSRSSASARIVSPVSGWIATSTLEFKSLCPLMARVYGVFCWPRRIARCDDSDLNSARRLCFGTPPNRLRSMLRDPKVCGSHLVFLRRTHAAQAVPEEKEINYTKNNKNKERSVYKKLRMDFELKGQRQIPHKKDEDAFSKIFRTLLSTIPSK